MAGAASAAVEDEWELCNDDGFIYKRRKRAQPDQGIPFASSSAQPHAADPETELKRNWLARRKLSLTTLRDRYFREIQQWEVLVASLQDGGRGGSDSYTGVGGGCDLLHLATEEKAGQDGAATGAASTTCDHQESDGILPPENPFHALVEELMSQSWTNLVTQLVVLRAETTITSTKIVQAMNWRKMMTSLMRDRAVRAILLYTLTF